MKNRAHSSKRPTPKARLALQRLEERAVPATFLVTNANDSGVGSLRAAIGLANANPDADVINFDTTGVFATPQTINLANLSGQLTISNPVTINGPGANLLTVRRIAGASSQFRVFNITRAAYQIDVTLSGMTITNGALQGPGSAGNGAGVFTGDEKVTLRNCVVTGNTTAGGSGAGAFVFSYGQLNVVNSTISGNTATTLSGSLGDGGGIATGFYSEISITGSTIAGNSGTGRGGGISMGFGGSLTVANSTISGNSAGLSGGGAYFYGPSIGRGLVFRNTTIANNSAGAMGGGIGVASGSATVNNPLSLQSCTITGNSAGVGGGINFINGGGTFTVASTVVANNSDAGIVPMPDIASVVPVNASFSLIRDHSGATYPNYAAQGNLAAGTNPLFAAAGLTNNGGLVNTIAIQSTSPLRNTGANAVALGFDSRGHGFQRVVENRADIGAYELGAGGLSAAGNQADGTISDLTAAAIATNAYTYQFSIVYTGTTPIDLSTLGTGDVSISGPNAFGQVATFVGQTSSGNQTTATYQIIAPGNYFDAADYGNYTAIVNVNAVRDTSGQFVPSGAAGTFRVLSSRTFTVSNTNDAGPGSLRQAILDANARSDSPDVIAFDPAIFSGAMPQTIMLSLANGQLNVFDSLTIVGPGADRLTISGDDVVRVLRVQIPGIGSATITGLRIADGLADNFVATNQANGGGLWASNESVTLDGVVIADNQSNAQGGGIGVGRGGSLTIRNSTISGNTVVAGGAYSSGGGIFFRSGGQLLMENCTVSGNTAITRGGGVYFFGDSTGTANGITIRNSTISGNSVTNSDAGLGSHGGGLALYFSYGAVTLQNCTITGNTVAGTNSGQGGGGIAAVLGNPSITAISTVIAQNTNANAPDVLGTLNSTNGLVGSAAGATLPNYGTQNNLPVGTNPLFVPGGAANNGGPVNTIALQAGSALLNAGANPAALTSDARGGAFVRSANGGVDIGAFEFQTVFPPRVVTTIVNDGSIQRSMVNSLTVQFNTNVAFNGSPASAFSLTRNGGGAVNFTLSLTTMAGATVATLSNFTGVESQFDSLADGRFTLTINDTLVSSFGGALDGDGNGVPGSPYVFGDADGLFRRFGDWTADRRVDGADFVAFVPAYNLHRAQPGFQLAFDFNLDERIDGIDFQAFVNRFNVPLPP